MGQYAHGLGRVLQHDPRSLQYPAKRRAAKKPRSVSWVHTGPVLDQGKVGSCTGNALAQCINTAGFTGARTAVNGSADPLDEKAALALYSLATTLDQAPGSYPPDDTGSSGLAVCKAGQQKGFLSGYQHAFGLDHFLDAMQTGPCIVGTAWTNAMFEPDSDGFVHPSGQVAGGHEYLALGIDTDKNVVTFLNSWGESWGQAGTFKMTFTDFNTLLEMQGDVCLPVPITANKPEPQPTPPAPPGPVNPNPPEPTPPTPPEPSPETDPTYAPLTDVYSCSICGDVIKNRDIHTAWHKAM